MADKSVGPTIFIIPQWREAPYRTIFFILINLPGLDVADGLKDGGEV